MVTKLQNMLVQQYCKACGANQPLCGWIGFQIHKIEPIYDSAFMRLKLDRTGT